MTARASNTLKFLTLGLLASSAAVNPSLAAVHEAQTEWAMNRIASVASGSYCTVAQQFDDQSVVTLAKNQSGEYSLAFDFTKPYFPDAKATKITLQPAGGQAQSFDVKPQTDKLVVIGIGANEGFINALKSSGKLDMKIEGQTKTFNTNKFADAAAELADCVSTMKAPATSLAAAKPAESVSTAQEMEAKETVQAVPKAPPVKVSTSRVSSQAEAPKPPVIAKAEPSIETARAEAPSAQPQQIQKSQEPQKPVQLAESAALKASETKPAARIAPAPVAAAAPIPAAIPAPVTVRIDQTAIRENEALKQQMAQMQAELQQAKSVAEQAAKPAPVTVRVDQTALRENEALKQQLAQLDQALKASQAERAALAQKTAEAATNGQQVANLQSQIAGSNQNIAKLQQELQAAKLAAETPKPSAAMIAELEKAKADLAAAQTQNQLLQVQAAEAAKLQKQNEELKAQVAASSQSVAQIQQQLQTAQSQAARTPAPNPAAIAEVERLKAELAAAQAKNQQLQAQSLQAAKAAQTAPQTSEQLAELQRQNKALQELIATSNKSTVELQAKLDAAQATANKGGTASPAVVAELEKARNEVQLARAENQKLKEQFAQSEQTLSAKTNNAPQLSIGAPVAQTVASDAALKENQALKIQLSRLEHELRSSKSAAAIAPASGEDSQTAKELAQLRAQMNIVQAENNQLKSQMDTLQTSADAGQIKASTNNWDLEQATRRYQESQREIRRLASLIETQQQQFEKEKRETEAMLFDPAITERAQQEKLDQLQARIDQLEAGGSVAPQQVPKQMAMAPVSASQSARQVPVARVEQEMLGHIDDMPDDISPAAGMETEKASRPATLPIPTPVVKAETAQKIAPTIQAKIEAPKPTRAIVAPVAQVSFQSRENFEQILNSSGINIRGGVEEMTDTSTAGYRAYRWKTDSLFGSAEQRAMKGGQGFETAVQQYLDRAESRCGGDFAAMPSDVSTMADQSKAYEIACIGGNTNTSASVIFTYSDDVMMTIAHEGKAEAMEMAMEAKDRIAGKIGSMKTASR